MARTIRIISTAYVGVIACGLTAGMAFGPPGMIIGAIIGGVIGGLLGWVGGQKIAEWVDGTVDRINGLIKFISTPKHIHHSSNLTCIPTTYILIKYTTSFKRTVQTSNIFCIPIA